MSKLLVVLLCGAALSGTPLKTIVARTFDGIAPSAGGEIFLLDEPVTIAGREYKWMPAHI